MPSRMVLLLVLVEMLGGLSSISGEEFSDTSSTDVKVDKSDKNMMMSLEDANMMMSPEDANMEPYNMYFSDYYILPSDTKEKTFVPPSKEPFPRQNRWRKKVIQYSSCLKSRGFGGDRYDEFLYPPQSYYTKWAEEEKEKDNMANC